MKIIDQEMLDRLSCAAAESDRRRRNLNVHEDYADPCQRLFNAVQPGSYIRPHRHVDPPKSECFVAVRGRMALVLFSSEGAVAQVVRFGAGCEAQAIDLPAGVWHSLVALEPGSIFFEVKPGPYLPLTDKDMAPWAPAEGSAAAAGYLVELIARVNPDS